MTFLVADFLTVSAFLVVFVSIFDCFGCVFATVIYQNIVIDLNHDNFEAGIIIDCFEDPTYSNNLAQPPAEENKENQSDSPSNQTGEANKPEANMGNSWYDLNVFEYTLSYIMATTNGKSEFGLNESADILLSGYDFNNSGGATKLNHPVSISANDGKLALTDRFNNRVLIWNSIPTSNTPPDLVLGQENFITHNSGSGLSNMDFPGQVVITPDAKILVADSDNNRVLVWTSFPTTSGQAADYAIPVTNYVNFGDSWPWGVWSDGSKVIVTATVAKSVLFWNSFPGPSTAPDVVLTSDQVGTPRSITSDGNYVMLGDENANGPCIGSNGTRSTHVWTSWPTASRDPDACIDNWLASAIYDSKIYGIAAGGGVGLALCGDIVIASEKAKFKLVFGPQLGIIPDVGASWLVPNLIGRAKANGLALLGDDLDSKQAYDWGLIWQVVKDEDLLPEAIKIAKRIANSAITGLKAVVKAHDKALVSTLDEQLNYERDTQEIFCNKDEFKEGVKAFLEKREPNFD